MEVFCIGRVDRFGCQDLGWVAGAFSEFRRLILWDYILFTLKLDIRKTIICSNPNVIKVLE